MPRCPNLDSKYGGINHYAVMKFREKLDDLSISDYQGLSSPGLTCYLNSVLQVLFMTEEFREAVKRNWSKSPAATFDFYLGELFYTLEGGMAKTHNIAKKLGIKNVFEQRDAAEYFEKILCRTNPNASEIFRAELNHKTTCLNCKKTNDSKNFFWVLPLSIRDSKSRSYSLLKGWRSFFKAQRVCRDNQMFCSHCNQKHDADAEYEMIHCPDVLTLLLKRFSFDYQQNRYVKLNCRVDVAQTLEIKSCRYDLYAVVHHFGDLMGGHYTADIKSFETGNWYCFNDNTVKCINEEYVTSGQNQIRHLKQQGFSARRTYTGRDELVSSLPRRTPSPEGYCAGSVDEVHFKEQKLEEDSFLSNHGIQHMSTVETRNIEMAVGVVVIDHDEEMFVELCDSEEQMGSMTLKELKEKIRDKFRPKYPERMKEDMSLIFENKRLNDDTNRLVDYGIIHKSSIYMVEEDLNRILETMGWVTRRNQTYELYAMVDHFGVLTGGHYTATIKPEEEESWYEFNDSTVTLLDNQMLQRKFESHAFNNSEHSSVII
ncbi:hypothetical protein CCH79_00012893 [Gambusia affinis]|uniref:Ubiquitinyl hydrolase 1 n=1 Tax=Gambusia affinis TaxID=33528 RepID=A0A315VZ49_GAMAF|nr:hypothetical protein CCH79_00012893 [Gambusia affinis]